MRITLIFPALLVFSGLFAQKIPTPSKSQLAWHDTEFYLFFHFGPNTFTNREWGEGTESDSLFNPSALNCEQWCQVAKAAGAKGVVLTAKHHDGFCLFPSKYSTHTVRESPWKNGQGDVVAELAAACKKHGLKMGLYLSPWDRNHPKYGTDEYNDVYAATLTELLTQYGDLFEIWWDGANGEGPNGKKQVYDFRRFEKIAAKLQPNAVVFSDIGPGCRWAGNERGVIETDVNWCMLDTMGFGRGSTGPNPDTLNRGNENGKYWIPAECDVSIRPGWFYHPEEDGKVKNADQLFQIYLNSVGKGANLILNVPPDRRGLIHPNDSTALVNFGKKLQKSFGTNIAAGKSLHNKTLTDGDRRSDLILKGEKPSITLDLGQNYKFNCIVLRENIQSGQRIRQFKIEIFEDGGWKEIVRANTIGARRILTFPATEARNIKVTILSSKPNPGLAEMEVYSF